MTNEEDLIEELLRAADDDDEEEEDVEEKLRSALIGIVISAQQDSDFSPRVVEQILEALGMGAIWSEAKLIARETAEETEELQETRDTLLPDPEPEPVE
jgi:hypothetical protein